MRQVQDDVYVIFGFAYMVGRFFAFVTEEVTIGAFVVTGILDSMNFIVGDADSL